MLRISAHARLITIETEQAPQFIDITEEVERAVADSGVTEGFALIYSRHTTAAIRINEAEPLLLRDMAEFLERVAPRECAYRHNDFSIRTANMTEDECPNGHAHCQHLLLGASEAIPILNGRLQLGRWQRVFLIELDRPRTREVLVQILGE
ncbi:MAG: secondary thiamine-phosphate synthase enzyme YjbQ [Candidatus Bipolaricaulia bacterium]